MITIDNVDVGYVEDTPVLKKINLSITADDRIALLGANGNGKSTLIKLISGHLKPMKGDTHRVSKLRVGYFAQHQTDELDVSSTPYHALRDAIGAIDEHKVRAMLGKFGFDKAKSDTKIAELSGGEKARLLFCMMSYDAPHIMLLDEPTNHLDIDARQALIQALNGYEGCIILVSHDSHLVEAVADRLYLVKDAGVTPYSDDLDAYRHDVIDQRRKEKADNKREKKEKKKNKKSKDKKVDHEANLAKWTAEKEKLELEMATPKALNKPDYMAEKVEQAENTWLEAQDDAA